MLPTKSLYINLQFWISFWWFYLFRVKISIHIDLNATCKTLQVTHILVIFCIYILKYMIMWNRSMSRNVSNSNYKINYEYCAWNLDILLVNLMLKGFYVERNFWWKAWYVVDTSIMQVHDTKPITQQTDLTFIL